jgi:hypothetical protein
LAGGLLGDLWSIAASGGGNLFEFLTVCGTVRLPMAVNDVAVPLDLISVGGSNRSSPSLDPGE